MCSPPNDRRSKEPPQSDSSSARRFANLIFASLCSSSTLAAIGAQARSPSSHSLKPILDCWIEHDFDIKNILPSPIFHSLHQLLHIAVAEITLLWKITSGRVAGPGDGEGHLLRVQILRSRGCFLKIMNWSIWRSLVILSLRS